MQADTCMNTTLIGASILPFCVDNVFGNVYFILARERFVAGWRGSLTWSDFGGRCEGSESAEECAAREFQEETMAVIPVTPRENSRSYAELVRAGARRDTEALATDLRAGGYTLRVNVASTSGTYTTFVKQVPWRPECQDGFRDVLRQARAGTLSPDHAVSGDGAGVSDVFLEKTCVKLWSVDQVRRLVSDTRRQRGPDRLRWGFHEKLGVIINQFPGNNMRVPVGCGQEGTHLSLETYSENRNGSREYEHGRIHHRRRTSDGTDDPTGPDACATAAGRCGEAH